MKTINTQSRTAARELVKTLKADGFLDAKVVDNGMMVDVRWCVIYTAPVDIIEEIKTEVIVIEDEPEVIVIEQSIIEKKVKAIKQVKQHKARKGEIWQPDLYRLLWSVWVSNMNNGEYLKVGKFESLLKKSGIYNPRDEGRMRIDNLVVFFFKVVDGTVEHHHEIV